MRSSSITKYKEQNQRYLCVVWKWRPSWSYSLCLRLMVRQNASPWSRLPRQTATPESPPLSGKLHMGLSLQYTVHIKSTHWTAHVCLYLTALPSLIAPAGLPCGHTHHGQSLSSPWGLPWWPLCLCQVPAWQWCKCKNSVSFKLTEGLLLLSLLYFVLFCVIILQIKRT